MWVGHLMLMCTVQLAKILGRAIGGIQVPLLPAELCITNHDQLLLSEINQQGIVLVLGIRYGGIVGQYFSSSLGKPGEPLPLWLMDSKGMEKQ
jgi:hypothetical protein